MNFNTDFTNLSKEFVELSKDASKYVDPLNKILNEISLNDRTIPNPDEIFQLICSFTRITPSEETESLIMKSICYMTRFLLHEQYKALLPEIELRKMVEWLLKCFYLNFEPMICEICKCLQIIFKHHHNLSVAYWEVCLSDDSRFIKYLNVEDIKVQRQKKPSKSSTSTPEETVSAIVCCLDSMLYIPEDFEGFTQLNVHLVTLGQTLMDLLLSNEIKFEPQSIPHLNFIIATLSILNKVALYNKDWHEHEFGYLLGISRAYMLCGIDGIPQLTPQKINISQQNIEPAPISNKGGKIAKTRKPRTLTKNKKSSDIISKSYIQSVEISFDNPLHHRQQTSDSDFSESEYDKTKHEIQKMAKIRLNAVCLIGSVLKSNGNKNLFGYWHSIFPSNREIPFSILTCSIRDPNPRCRIAALQAASLLIYGSKNFLWQAENNDKSPKTFTPFSISLGNMILIMYEQLEYSLANESSIPVLTQVLKCLSLLVQATPFHRLKPGFVTKFVQQIKKLFNHKDPSVVVGALTVMEFLISSSGITTEIFSLVGIPKKNENRTAMEPKSLNIINDSYEDDFLYEEENVENKTPVQTSSSAHQISWLLETVLENFGFSKEHANVNRAVRQVSIRIESLQILSALSKHFQCFIGCLEIIVKVLLIELGDTQEEIRIYTAKCLDSITHGMNNFLALSLDNIEECKQFWLTILPGAVEAIQKPSTNHIIKATLCDFLSNIGANIFESLDHSKHMELVKLLSGVSCIEEPSVKSAAVRVLAVYSLFPSMKDDLCFIENTAELILPLLKEKNLFVRVRASWSLGNISESRLTNSNSDYDRISDYLLQKLLQSTKESVSDNDKVKSNAVRTLGNLLCLILPKHIENFSWRKLILECIEKLISAIKTGNNVKVKWNACYAVGNFLKNHNLFTIMPDFNWEQNVFDNLCYATINNINFKVRITASAALQKIESRALYGDNFIPIWKSLILAMEQSDNLVDFNEYNHRDNLQEQLCFCFCHFLNLADEYNLVLMSQELLAHKDVIMSIWLRVLNRMVPESSGKLLSTSTKLKELSKDHNEIKHLSECFPEPINTFQ